ncbi:MAG: helix-turn-helix domain-containing protein [Deltaproteobacteria bacterium]|nr:MAG: helix-turn-helix domain-containing protein [Deltaproteobacteria bacterium]
MTTRIRITRQEIDAYKREILEETVLVTIRDAAAVLQVSESTVRRRIDEGRIPVYGENGRESHGLRILASELRAYVRSIRLTVNDD